MGEKSKGVNKMKKWLLLLIGMGILFSGCTSNNTRTKSTEETDTAVATTKSKAQSTEQTTSETKKSVEVSASENSTTKSSSVAPVKTEEVKNALWNANKASQLETFISQWQTTVGQRYKSYSPKNNLDLYGLSLPSSVISGNFHMAINENPVNVQWSEDGTGNSGFNLVAVYSDAETADYLGQHVYFFGFQNGQPKVYITQQNQGNEYNNVYFNETQNQQLKQGFNDIVNGQELQTSIAGTTTTQQSQQASTSVISSWEEAKQLVLDNKALWLYDTPDKNEATTNIIESTQYMTDMEQDENGSYYPVVISTDDGLGTTTMNGGKQFKVYTDGRISQRIGMTNNSQIIK